MLYILNYKNNKTYVPVDLTSDKVLDATITVISGDEVLNVYYTDGSHEMFDSAKDRSINYFDCEYKVKSDGKLIGFYNAWLRRHSSYDFDCFMRA